MLQLSNKLHSIPVLSLRTGSQIATAIAPVINPNNLKIEGFYCQDNRSASQPVLLTQDIREQIPEGFVINDYDVLSEPTELIRLEETLQLQFELIGKIVKTTGKKRVGKLTDYAVDLESFYIHKLYVGQSIVKSLTGGALIVDRSQITEITSKEIIIDDLLKPISNRAPATS